VDAKELTDTQNYMSGLYLLRLETQEGVANQLNAMKTLGLPNTYLETYVQRVRAVTAQNILEAAKKYLSPSEAAVVVVGDNAKIGDALKKIGNVTVTKAE
jgi:predicted Zn-dependent peptidase